MINKKYLIYMVSTFLCIFLISGQEEAKIKPIKANTQPVNQNCFFYGKQIDCAEYIPLFKVIPLYPRRAQERGTQGWTVVKFTITESGSVENAVAVEGYCGDPKRPQDEARSCSIFNTASERAALKLKYKPKIVDGKAVPVPDVLHRFTFIMAKD